MVAEPLASASSEAVDALERVVRNLGDELAFFRRRALDAERRMRDLLAHQAPPRGDASGARPPAVDSARVHALEVENAELRARLAEAADRARAVANRMRFARQQDESSPERMP